jgi:hypothetical protein
MASRRILKRNVNHMVFDIVDECFMIMGFDESKTDACEKLIDEAADFQDTILEKINAAKTKADFRPIRETVENAAIDFIKKLNALS